MHGAENWKRRKWRRRKEGGKGGRGRGGEGRGRRRGWRGWRGGQRGRRRGRGRSEEERGGESVENLVRGDSFKAKAEAKPKQSKIHKTRRQAGGFKFILFTFCLRWFANPKMGKKPDPGIYCPKDAHITPRTTGNTVSNRSSQSHDSCFKTLYLNTIFHDIYKRIVVFQGCGRFTQNAFLFRKTARKVASRLELLQSPGKVVRGALTAEPWHLQPSSYMTVQIVLIKYVLQ